jgi:hypothetical protein
MAEKAWLREHAIKTAVGTILALALGAVVAALSPLVREWLLIALRGIGNAFHWLGQPVTVARWHYWLLAVVAIFVGIFMFVAVFAVLTGRRGPAATAYLAYQEDSFFGLTWRWGYDLAGQLNRESFTPYCPVCDRVIPMRSDSYDPFTRFACDACGEQVKLDGDIARNISRVIREIDLKVRKGTWIDKGKAAGKENGTN